MTEVQAAEMLSKLDAIYVGIQFLDSLLYWLLIFCMFCLVMYGIWRFINSFIRL